MTRQFDAVRHVILNESMRTFRRVSDGRKEGQEEKYQSSVRLGLISSSYTEGRRGCVMGAGVSLIRKVNEVRNEHRKFR